MDYIFYLLRLQSQALKCSEIPNLQLQPEFCLHVCIHYDTLYNAIYEKKPEMPHAPDNEKGKRIRAEQTTGNVAFQVLDLAI